MDGEASKTAVLRFHVCAVCAEDSMCTECYVEGDDLCLCSYVVEDGIVCSAECFQLLMDERRERERMRIIVSDSESSCSSIGTYIFSDSEEGECGWGEDRAIEYPWRVTEPYDAKRLQLVEELQQLMKDWCVVNFDGPKEKEA